MACAPPPPCAPSQLRQLLAQPQVDLVQLRSFARLPGGFQSSALRKLVWPKLLSVNRFAPSDHASLVSKHRDDYQIWCDVTRLWGYLAPMKDCSDHYQGRRRSVSTCPRAAFPFESPFHDH
jgi:hypothetical protein